MVYQELLQETKVSKHADDYQNRDLLPNPVEEQCKKI